MNTAETRGRRTTAAGAAAPGRVTAGLEDLDLARGDRLDRYVVLALRGRGGMGVVLEAFDPELDRKVALKLLRPHEDARESTRLLQEARALARFSHPHVATVHDVGTRGDRIFIAMELVEGPTLGEWMRRGRRGWRELRDMFVRAGEGLAAAHAAGIVHRDFKPSNVVVGGDGRPRVIDFGLAGPGPGPSAPASSASASGDGDPTPRAAGTPLYMAPEVHEGARADAAADQYSFCVSLYEALLGRRPFRGDAEGALASAKRKPLRWSSLPRPVPRWLRRVVARGMAAEPGARYPTMPGLLDQLRRDPARRWQAAGAVVGVAVGAAALATAVRPERRDAPCGALAERIDAAWSRERRAALERVVRRGGPSDDASWRSIDARVGDHVDALRRALDESCDPEVAPGTRERRRACVLDRAVVVEQFVDAASETTQGEAAVPVELIASAVASLVPPDDCVRSSEPARLGAGADEPGARGALARAEALWLTGRYPEAIAAIEPVLEGAERRANPGLRARAQLALGNASYAAGDYEVAAEHLAAAALGAEAVGEDRVAASAAVAYLCTTGYELADVERARSWEPHARAAVARVGSAPLLDAALSECVGMTHFGQGEMERARPHYERALELRRAHLPEAHLDLAFAHNNLANLDYAEGDVESALEHAAAALSMREQLLGSRHPEVARSLVTLSNILRAVGRSDEALDALRRAVALEREALGEEHDSLAVALNNLAGLLAARGQLGPAEEAYAEAQGIWERREPPPPELELVRVNRASLMIRQGAFVEAISRLRDIVGRREARYGVRSAKLIAPLGNLGHALQRRGRCAEAVRAVGRALDILDATLGPRHPHASGLWLISGRALACAGERGRAREAFERARARLDPAARCPGRRAELELGLAQLELASEPRAARHRVEVTQRECEGLEPGLVGALTSVGAMAAAADGSSPSAAEVDSALAGLAAGGRYWAAEREAFEAWLAARDDGGEPRDDGGEPRVDGGRG